MKKTLKTLCALTVILSAGLFTARAQKYSLYSDQTLTIDSKHIGQPIELTLQIPETLPFSAANARYPITIIFDSQHERSYPHIVQSIDLLTSETQVPEMIVVGIPFTFQNRYYLTSNQKMDGDKSSGIEKLDAFLFDELLPTLRQNHKGGDFVTLVGHSRTAFLVNFLTLKNPEKIRVAAALSGFYEESPISIDSFVEFLSNPVNFPKPLSYYLTVGGTLEESPYRTQIQRLLKQASESPSNERVKVWFAENPHANHMSNFWMSVPLILVDAFAAYNGILDNWFHGEASYGKNANPIDFFQADLETVGSQMGTKLLPSLTHIFSLSSKFASDEDNYATAIAFLELGLQYYPDYADFYVDLIEYQSGLGNDEKVKEYKDFLLRIATSNTALNDDQKRQILEYLENL